MIKVGPDIDATHLGGGHNRSQAFGSSQTFFRVVAKGDLPGNHRLPETSFSNVVGRRDMFDSGEKRHRFPVLHYSLG